MARSFSVAESLDPFQPNYVLDKDTYRGPKGRKEGASRSSFAISAVVRGKGSCFSARWGKGDGGAGSQKERD